MKVLALAFGFAALFFALLLESCAKPGDAVKAQSDEDGGEVDFVPSTIPVEKSAADAADGDREPGRHLTALSKSSKKVHVGTPVPGKSGFVYTPYLKGKPVDVQGFDSGTEVKCPYTGKVFLVP